MRAFPVRELGHSKPTLFQKGIGNRSAREPIDELTAILANNGHRRKQYNANGQRWNEGTKERRERRRAKQRRWKPPRPCRDQQRKKEEESRQEDEDDNQGISETSVTNVRHHEEANATTARPHQGLIQKGWSRRKREGRGGNVGSGEHDNDAAEELHLRWAERSPLCLSLPHFLRIRRWVIQDLSLPPCRSLGSSVSHCFPPEHCSSPVPSTFAARLEDTFETSEVPPYLLLLPHPAIACLSPSPSTVAERSPTCTLFCLLGKRSCRSF